MYTILLYMDIYFDFLILFMSVYGKKNVYTRGM